MVFNEKLLHPFQPYNREATANQLDYFERVMGFPIKIASSNQIWQLKEFFTLLNMVISLIMLVPLTRFFLNISFFKTLINPVPSALPKQTREGKLVFWTIFVVSAAIACISFIPMVDLAKTLFTDAANRELTWFFPQRMNTVSYTHLRAHETS